MKNWGVQPDEKQLSELVGTARPKVCRKKGHFIYRVPVDWAAAAAILPGKCLAVGLALWFKFGMEKKRQVKVTRELLRKFGVNRYAGRRAINQLEAAGLVAVDRGQGRSSLVTIIDIEADDGKSNEPLP
jgi:hypothetical protein